MSLELQFIWDEVFENPPATADEIGAKYDGETRIQYVTALQLSGWGNCMAGAKMPEGFGYAMALMSTITGAATPDECMAKAETLKTNAARAVNDPA